MNSERRCAFLVFFLEIISRVIILYYTVLEVTDTPGPSIGGLINVIDRLSITLFCSQFIYIVCNNLLRKV